MAALAVEVLEEWRAAERLLEVLPNDAPERRDVEAIVADLRALYRRLTDETFPSSIDRLEDAPLRIERARNLLHGTLDRLSQHQG